MTFIWILLGAFTALAGLVILFYNQLIAAKQLVDNGWSDIDVQLKRRADLIPQIVNTVQAYAKHEKQLFKDVTEKRNQAMSAGNDPRARSAAEGALSKPVSRLLAVAENYPDLKANENFLDLQNELSDTENKIEMARRFYNGAVRQLNTKVQSFPVNLIAGVFGFKTRDYFDIDETDSPQPDVDFKS